MNAHRRRIVRRVGIVMTVLGAAPLCLYGVHEWFTGDPANPGNPIGLGFLFFAVGGTGLLLLLVAVCYKPDDPRAR